MAPKKVGPKKGSDTKDIRHRRIKIGGSILILCVAALIGWSRLTSQTSAEVADINRVFMCAEQGKTFNHDIEIGETQPIKCEICGKHDAYRPEQCFWNKDADGTWKAKSQPTFVILKSKLDPNSTEKTTCPDCGKEVRPHNPMPPLELMEEARAANRTS